MAHLRATVGTIEVVLEVGARSGAMEDGVNTLVYSLDSVEAAPGLDIRPVGEEEGEAAVAGQS